MKLEIKYYRVPLVVDMITNRKKGKPPEEHLMRYGRGRGFIFDELPDKFWNYPSPRGGACMVAFIDNTNHVLTKAASECSMSDIFCYKTGRDIALTRLWRALPKRYRKDFKLLTWGIKWDKIKK